MNRSETLKFLEKSRENKRIADSWDGTLIQPLRDAVRALELNPVLPAQIPLRIFSGDVLHVDLRDRVAQDLYVFGMTEPDLTEFEIIALSEGNIVYDVGAHMGYHSLIAARAVGVSGRVLAFEPTPRTFRILKENTSQLSNIECYQMAVGEIECQIELLDYGPSRAAFNSIVGIRDASKPSEHDFLEKIKVNQTSLDKIFMATNAKPNYIKIDVESAESLVIAGMSNLINIARPTIALELGDFYHLQEAGVPSSRMLIDILGVYNYRPYEFKNGHLVAHQMLGDGLYPYMNTIFLPVEGGSVGSEFIR